MNRHKLAVVLGAFTALGPLTIDMYLPALPSIAAEFGVPDSSVQLTVIGFLLGLAGGQLVMGPLSDRFGRRLPLVVGLSLHIVASVVCIFAPGIQTLLAARILQGVGGSAGGVVAIAVIRDLYVGLPAARLLARLMLVTGLAPILAPTLGSLLLRLVGWRGLFGVLAGVGVLLIVLAVVAVPETLPPERRRPGGLASALRSYRTLLSSRQFVGLCVTAGFAITIILAYVSGSSFVLQQQYGLSPTAFGIAFGANAVGLILATQLTPMLLNRWSAARLLTTGLTLAVVASVTMVVLTATGTGGVWGLVVPLFAAFSSAGLALPNLPALALARHGAMAGTGAALLGACQFGIGALIAPLAGAGGTVTATSLSIVMAASAAAALLVLLVVVRPRTLQSTTETVVASSH